MFPLLNNSSTYIIAEIGVNHNGNLETAKKLIDVAKMAGADAVKFQTFNATKLASKTAKKAAYQQVNDPKNESQYKMLKRLELAETDLLTAADYTRARGLEFLSTPFDKESAVILDQLNVAAFKVSSGDLTALGFLAYLAKFNRPMIISTGMGTLIETAEAVKTIQDNGNPPLAILHCVSQYPALAKDANLRAMDTMKAAFQVPIGWSDHTLGSTVSIAAVARGARIVEKHFTLSKDMSGPDHKASLEPNELIAYIADIRNTEAALGDGIKRPCLSEMDTIAAARRSLIVAQDIEAGGVLTNANINIQRPGTGLPPKTLQHVIGRTTVKFLRAGKVLCLEDLVQ